MAHRGSPKPDCCSNDGSEGDHSEGDYWCRVSFNDSDYSGDISSESYSGDNHSDDDIENNREEVSLAQRIGRKRKGAEQAEQVPKRLCTHPEDTGATDQNENSKAGHFDAKQSAKILCRIIFNDEVSGNLQRSFENLLKGAYINGWRTGFGMASFQRHEDQMEEDSRV